MSLLNILLITNKQQKSRNNNNNIDRKVFFFLFIKKKNIRQRSVSHKMVYLMRKHFTNGHDSRWKQNHLNVNFKVIFFKVFIITKKKLKLFRYMFVYNNTKRWWKLERECWSKCLENGVVDRPPSLNLIQHGHTSKWFVRKKKKVILYILLLLFE